MSSTLTQPITPEAILALAKGGADEAALCALAERIKMLSVSDARGAMTLADTLLSASGEHTRARVRSLAARAHARSYCNDFAGAEADLSVAAGEARAGGLDDELGPLSMARVQPLARQGRLDEAMRAAREAVELAGRAGQPLVAAKARVNLGGVLMMSGDAAGALACYDQALLVLGAEPIAGAMIRSNRAEALLELDRFGEAERSFALAAAGFASAGHAHGEAVCLGNEADLLSRMGLIDRAVVRFEAARARLATLGATGDAARLLAEQAEGLFAAGAWRSSVALFERAVPELAGAGLRRERARALLCFGLALARCGAIDRSLRALTEAVGEAGAIGAGLVLADAQVALAQLRAAAGDCAEARRLLAGATAALDDRPVRLAAACATGAGVELDDGHPRAALLEVDRGLAGLGELGVAPLRTRLAHVRGRALRALGDKAGASATLLAAVAGAEAYRGAIRAEQLRVSYLESTQRLYLDAASCVLDEGGPEAPERVFDLVERLRQRTLLEARAKGVETAEALSLSDARQHAQDGPDEATQELNAIYAELGPAGRAGAGRGERNTELARLGQRLRTLEEAAEHRRLVAGSAGGEAPAEPGAVAEPVTLAEFAGRLGDAGGQAGAVSFFVDGAGLSALVVTGRGAEVARGVLTCDAMRTLRRRFDMALARDCEGLGGRQRALDLAREIRRAVMGPLAGHLAGCRGVMVAPFGELHGVPLLAAGAAEGVDGHAVRAEWYIPGCTFAARAGARLPDEPAVLAVGVGDEAAPRAEDEAARVAGVWPGARLLVGRGAAAAEVMAALAEADVVHLATHAVFDPEFPGSSRLLMGDGWMTARRFARALKPGAVVVLAGCGTGRSDQLSGEERYGLVRSVLAAGAGTVVAAQWPLHDGAAAELLPELHGLTRVAIASRAGGGGGRAGSVGSLGVVAGALAALQRRAAAGGMAFHQWGPLTVTGACA